MNDQILELARQKGATAEDGGKATTIFCFTEQELKGFAKSILLECVGIYIKIDNGNLHMGTDNYITALHKNFGVEE
jgi:hypothetical protein